MGKNKLKKRTLVELIVFAVVALIYLGDLLANRPSNKVQTPPQSVVNAAIDAADTALTKSIADPGSEEISGSSESFTVEEDGEYTDKEHVALYIHTYGRLPSNYISKEEAKAAGYSSSKNNLSKVCPGKSIGGDNFQNREKLLPEKKGRKYFECDIDYNGKRNAKRIVFSSDGLIYYTDDHYQTFELLYGDE